MAGLEVPAKAVAGEAVTVKVTVTNTGKVTGDEVVQLYLTDEKASTPRPLRQLGDSPVLHLNPGEIRTVEFTLYPEQFSIINNKDVGIIEPDGLHCQSADVSLEPSLRSRVPFRFYRPGSGLPARK